jgi:phospholipid/cholesterol/gamma-HCH transport system substrate-binding protein
MKLKYRFAEQVVGAFILLAIASLTALLILMGFNKRWFAHDYQFYSIFSSADGLNTGMSIKLRGFRIGTVDEILLDEENRVVMHFHIFEEYIEKVKVNSVLELASNPLGLGGGLRFHPGRSLALAIGDEEIGYIPSLDTEEGRRRIEQNLVDTGDSGDSISQLINEVNATVVTLNSVLAKLDSALEGTDPGPVGTILANVEEMTGEITSVAAGVTDVVADVGLVVGDADDLIDELSTRIYGLLQSIAMIADDITALTEGLTDSRGLVTKLLDPKGSIAKILDDDEVLFTQIEEILAGVDDTVQQLSDFTVYLNSATPQISGVLEEGRDVLDQGQDVLEGLRNNPLLRGGISEGKEQPTTFQSYRDEDF